jgi:hypothetical protein
VPLVLAVAYALFLVAEKPFLSKRLQTQISAAVSGSAAHSESLASPI